VTNTDGRTEGDKIPPSGPWWKKSSWSAQNGHCVEVARLSASSIGVRDSKDNASVRPVLVFTNEDWTGFLVGIRAGEFEFPER
jgi:hypothetical protein